MRLDLSDYACTLKGVAMFCRDRFTELDSDPCDGINAVDVGKRRAYSAVLELITGRRDDWDDVIDSMD